MTSLRVCFLSGCVSERSKQQQPKARQSLQPQPSTSFYQVWEKAKKKISLNTVVIFISSIGMGAACGGILGNKWESSSHFCTVAFFFDFYMILLITFFLFFYFHPVIAMHGNKIIFTASNLTLDIPYFALPQRSGIVQWKKETRCQDRCD